MLDGPEQSGVVEPVHPLQGGQFHGLPGFPRRPAVGQLSLVEHVDCLCQGVVVAVAKAADGGFYAGLGQPFGVYGMEMYWTPLSE